MKRQRSESLSKNILISYIKLKKPTPSIKELLPKEIINIIKTLWRLLEIKQEHKDNKIVILRIFNDRSYREKLSEKIDYNFFFDIGYPTKSLQTFIVHNNIQLNSESQVCLIYRYKKPCIRIIFYKNKRYLVQEVGTNDEGNWFYLPRMLKIDDTYRLPTCNCKKCLKYR